MPSDETQSGNAAKRQGYPGQYGPVKTRLLALAQFVTAPLVLAWFLVVEPELVPEWPGYVGRCSLTMIDGRAR